jgi:2-iminobutanoate/2-iminopropanoate deaminase
MKEIKTDKAPLPVGPYSQAVETGNFVFVSGILPINLETKELEKDVRKAAKLIFSHLDQILEKAVVSKKQITKVGIYMTELKNFKDLNEEYAKYFEGLKVMPARSTIEVKGLPMGSNIEMDFIVQK